MLDFIRDLYKYSKKHFIQNVIFMIISGVTSGAGILLLIPLLSLIGIIDSGSIGINFIGDNLDFLKQMPENIQLMIILVVYVLLITFQVLFSRKMAVLNVEIVQGYVRHLRVELYKRTVHVEWSSIVSKNKSDIANTFAVEISRIASGSVIFLKIISELVLFLVQMAIAFYISPPLTAFVMICGIVLAFLMKSTLKESKTLGSKIQSTNKNLLFEISEQLNGIKEVKSYGIEDAQISSFSQICSKVKENLLRFTKLQSRPQILYKTGAAVIISIIFYLMVTFFKIEPSAMIIILYIFSRVWPTFSSFQGNLQNILVAIPSYMSYKELLAEFAGNESKEKSSDQTSSESIVSKQQIRFDHVSFAYRDEESSFRLEDLSFTLPANKMTAIVGKSGAGKSTIIDLLMMFLKPKSGRILADETEINASNEKSWRKQIAYVPQDPFLMNGTIRENLTRFNPGSGDEEIKDAMEMAAAWDFTSKFPEGLNTQIGDRGIKLSGGEKQRIVLARALLRKPSILVLDEATSSLDNESEFAIQQAIGRLRGSLTLIVIAHRLSTVKNADQMLVIDSGKVIESGPYESLAVKEGGSFSRMLDFTR